MVTLEEIKERYPEGCEVRCAMDKKDKEIVLHDKIYINTYGSCYFNNMCLYFNVNNEFATITKPAPESKQDKPKRYKDKEVHGMDVIDLAKFWNLNFNEGNILKYLLRDKGQDANDMQKIADYAQRENKFLNNKNK
jgi:hypothetical protein